MLVKRKQGLLKIQRTEHIKMEPENGLNNKRRNFTIVKKYWIWEYSTPQIYSLEHNTLDILELLVVAPLGQASTTCTVLHT